MAGGAIDWHIISPYLLRIVYMWVCRQDGDEQSQKGKLLEQMGMPSYHGKLLSSIVILNGTLLASISPYQSIIKTLPILAAP